MITIEGNQAPGSVVSGLYGPAAAFLAAALSLILLLRGNSTGNTYYVSPTGSNSNPCTQSSPCATPDYVVNNKASAGDIVEVAAGTYDYGSSEVHFTKSGAAGKYITLSCATRGACRIQNSVTGNSTVIEIDSNYLTFDGFEVTNTSAAGNNLGIYVTSSFVNVTRNKIHHIEIDCSSVGGGGIVTTSGSPAVHDMTVDSNLIYDIGWPIGGSPKCPSSTVQTDGILTETPGANIVITNNIVYYVSGGWGIAHGANGSGTSPVTIMNNLVFENANGGILIIGGGGGSTVANNIVLNNGVVAGQCGIGAPSGVSITYANNDLWNNNGGSYCIEWSTSDQSVHSNDISVDPSAGTTFVNWKADGSGDYHQKSGSPTIDAGTSSSPNAPKVDFDGNPRPRRARYAIGPYEYPTRATRHPAVKRGLTSVYPGKLQFTLQ
jgi:parallel beta-helix repeat protein